MTSRIDQVTIDVLDIDVMSRFWSSVFGYEIHQGDDGCAKLEPGLGAPSNGPSIWLQVVDSVKVAKNRCHLDLVSDDPAGEVQRLLELGATRADVGQKGDEGFDVLADPEGNEFCVLRRADTSSTAGSSSASLRDDPDAPGLSALGLQPDDPVEPNEPA
jgi:hypothetical protein